MGKKISGQIIRLFYQKFLLGSNKKKVRFIC